MKKTDCLKKWLSLFLALVFALSAANCGFGVVSKAAAVYSSDYRYWSQGASGLEKMRLYGCWIVAQSKLIYETNVNREESFNPDVYYYWQKETGFVDSGFYQTNGGYAPVSYSKEKGKPLEYLGYFKATEEKLWENIENGYYSVLQLNNGGHYVYLDNETSKKKKKLYCFDSWSEQYSYGTRLLSNYKKWDVCYVYKIGDPNDLLRPSKPSLLPTAAVFPADGELSLSWSAVSGAEGYRLRILDEGGKSVKTDEIKTETGAKYTLPKGKYTVSLVAFNSYGDSPESTANVEAVSGYTVTLDPNGGTCAKKSINVSFGSTYGNLPKPKRTGYKFSGWYTAKTGGTRVTAATTVKTEANHTLYARWSHTHAYTEKITLEPTCEKEGIKTFTCVCKDSYTEKIPPLEHKYDASTEKATPVADGLFKVACVYCGNVAYSSAISRPDTPVLSKESFLYNGKEKTPSVTVKDKNGKLLYPDADYTLSFKNNKNGGKAAAVISFCGDYEGTSTVLFDIVPKKAKNVSVKQNAKALTVSWSAAKGASGYKVTLMNKNQKVLKTEETKKTSLRFKNLKSGTKYTVSVQPFGRTEDGTVYAESTKPLLTATKPSAPEEVSVTAGRKSAKLSFKKSFGATGYTVYYGTDKKSGFKKLETKRRTVTIGNLKSGTVYYFKVTANKEIGGKTISSAFSKNRAVRVK